MFYTRHLELLQPLVEGRPEWVWLQLWPLTKKQVWLIFLQISYLNTHFGYLYTHFGYFSLYIYVNVCRLCPLLKKHLNQAVHLKLACSFSQIEGYSNPTVCPSILSCSKHTSKTTLRNGMNLSTVSGRGHCEKMQYPTTLTLHRVVLSYCPW